MVFYYSNSSLTKTSWKWKNLVDILSFRDFLRLVSCLHSSEWKVSIQRKLLHNSFTVVLKPDCNNPSYQSLLSLFIRPSNEPIYFRDFFPPVLFQHSIP